MKESKTSKYFIENNLRINEWLINHVEPVLQNSVYDYDKEINHAIDFLQSKESPNKITRLGFIDAIRDSEKWTDFLNRKSSTEENEEDVQLVLESGAYRWVKLITENSFKREGLLMSHCAASYSSKSDIEIYSLRDINNNPHCTIEYQTNKEIINQVKGKGNSFVSPKYQKSVIEFINFKKTIKIRDFDKFGGVLIEGKVYHVDDIPDDSKKQGALFLSHYKKLPKKMSIDGDLILSKPLNNKMMDLTEWSFNKRFELNNASAELKKINVEELIVMNSKLVIKEINTKRDVIIVNSDLNFEKISAESVLINNSKCDVNNIHSKKISLESINNVVVFREARNYFKLTLECAKVVVEKEIEVDDLILKNCTIDNQSLMKIKVNRSVSIEDCSELIIPNWCISRHTSVVHTPIKDIIKGFNSGTFFGSYECKKIMNENGITYNDSIEIDSSGIKFDIEKAYFIKK